MSLIYIPRRVIGTGFVACVLCACSRPEPSESNVGRLRATIGTTAASSTPARALEGVVASSSSQIAVPPSLPSVSASNSDRGVVAAVLARARKGGKTEVEYLVPNHEELERYRSFVLELFSARTPSSDLALRVPDGFQLDSLGPRAVALLESPTRRRGAAALVLRLGAASPICVEVPHSFFDESTLPIGLALYEAARARALLVNTVHRYRTLADLAENVGGSENDELRRASSDVAHADVSYFSSAHEAFIEAFPSGLVIQLHGFRDGSAPGHDIVLSAANTSAPLHPIAERLRLNLGLSVALYPSDIRKLGGTTNAQARRSRKRMHPFVHIEISQSLRRRLVEDEGLLSRFATSLVTEER